MMIGLTELIPKRSGTLIALRANRSRDVKYRPLLPKHNWLFFVIPDLSFPFIAANCQTVLELSFSACRQGAPPLCGEPCASYRNGREHMSQQSSECELKSLLVVFGL